MYPLNYESHEFDVCVVGGGMAGMCAAIASARNGARTAIVHDRPVFGGNASSEVRMWICGAHGRHNKEAGLLEEIQLENQYRNPSLNYSVWDSVLYGKMCFQPNLSVFLNSSCTDAVMDGSRISGISAWQLTTQTWHSIKAQHFIDCSGDSILAPLTGANYRVGREARNEFDEDIQPELPDLRTMGNSLLIQMRRTSEPQPYIPPRWAYKFTRPEDLPHRIDGVKAHNFWWLEIGGLNDTIKDAEAIRDELMKICYGVWDYIKNYAPERDAAKNWAIEWIGSLPGKRENRRYVGDHVLTQNDLRAGGVFEDIIAYGGWSMDDHHPAGLLHEGVPTVFHPCPSPYGIPYRSIYSNNITNLFMAGRNISVTHAALSSTRVMGTCAILGQAAGTAASLCVSHSCNPRDLGSGAKLRELQQTLLDDDCWLPGIDRDVSDLALTAELKANGEGARLLLDGMDRDREDEIHAWEGRCGDAIEYAWPEAVQLKGFRLTFDSNLNNDKRMPCAYPQSGNRCLVPSSLVKGYRIEATDESGLWTVIHREENNYRRCVSIPLAVNTNKVRFVPEETWGSQIVRLFACEPLDTCSAKIPELTEGASFASLRLAYSKK